LGVPVKFSRGREAPPSSVAAPRCDLGVRKVFTILRENHPEIQMGVETDHPQTIAELRRRVENYELSIADIRRLIAAQVDAHKELNAFITLMFEDASHGNAGLPLAGVPVAVKDFYDTAGVRTTAGAAQFANRIPTEDAALVNRLKRAGAMIVGKTNMHTLGMGTTSLESHFGPVRNPWMADRVAGGSSGGSASAVASGICFATVDTDAVGSARLPAACCAVTGFKPSYGTLSPDGILKGEPADATVLALNHPSIIARIAEDVGTIFSILAEGPHAPARSNPRLGLVSNYEAADAMKQAFETVAPSVLHLAPSAIAVNVPFSEARFDPSGIPSARALINERLFADVDLIILPTLVDPVPTVEDANEAGAQAVSPANTFFANYFGLPAISIPMEMDDVLGPLALQIVGPIGADLTVLEFARQVQNRFPPGLAVPHQL
jgi:aspartyl-tRNA(Asn)/glutamyl-tRNA(Gln) amidotransferase subunit A